mgnify:CR=1 FL=1
MSMFCYQCEQTAGGKGCEKFGVCGKDPDTAALQDLLIHIAKGVSGYAHRAAGLGARDAEVDRFVVEALFTTVTNVSFDPKRLEAQIRRGVKTRERAKSLYEKACKKSDETPEALDGPATWTPKESLQALIAQGRQVGVDTRIQAHGADAAGLEELICYGLKGTAAYADHAQILGQEDPEIYAFFHSTLDFLTQGPHDAETLTKKALEVGEKNLRVMELLDAANTGAYGHPTPTSVRIHPKKGKAILVSGHDLKDLEELLKQTEGKGIQIYTHGEMLPAHGYPGLNKYPHLAGNYGGAWQDQRKEFEDFPGAILMTTNCIQKPKPSYKERIFTCGLVAWPDVTHISDREFSPVIEAALKAPGFEEDGDDDEILVGFGHNAVLGVAPQVTDAVKNGDIRHFLLIGGCDGAKSGRNYYPELAEKAPKDTVILTLACGKYRFNKMSFGDIGGIPRLLDVGQCNDAYSAVKIASALADAFDTDVNGLPLSLVLSWYEQKAVCILLSLLHLGIQDIRLGPSLPAFVTPPVLNVLVETFGLQPIKTPQEDLDAILNA